MFSAEKKSEIDECKNFKQLFDVVGQHLSWDEYSFLCEIIDECGSVEAEQEINQYKRKMAISEALEIISSTESNPPLGFEKFCVRISKPYEKLTIIKYEQIKTFIFKNLNVNRYVTNKYIRIMFNPLHLEWHVTIQALPHMIKMAHERQAVFKNICYVFMKIGKENINMHTQQEAVSCSYKIYEQVNITISKNQTLQILYIANRSR